VVHLNLVRQTLEETTPTAARTVSLYFRRTQFCHVQDKPVASVARALLGAGSELFKVS
jgi:hypothetical protein